MFGIIDNSVQYVYNCEHMNNRKPRIYPHTEKKLKEMGEQIKLARLRRKLTASLVAERAGISRTTLYMLEKGSSSVSIGALAAVLSSIGGLENDILLIAKDDVLGRTYQDLGLITPKRGR